VNADILRASQPFALVRVRGKHGSVAAPLQFTTRVRLREDLTTPEPRQSRVPVMVLAAVAYWGAWAAVGLPIWGDRSILQRLLEAAYDHAPVPVPRAYAETRRAAPEVHAAPERPNPAPPPSSQQSNPSLRTSAPLTAISAPMAALPTAVLPTSGAPPPIAVDATRTHPAFRTITHAPRPADDGPPDRFDDHQPAPATVAATRHLPSIGSQGARDENIERASTRDRVLDSAQPEPAEPPSLRSHPSCEAALATYEEHIDLNGPRAPADVPSAAYAAILDRGSYFAHCGVPAASAIDICAAIQSGRAVGVTVNTRPRNAILQTCIARAVHGLRFPVHPKLDVARTHFAPNGG
jgi:hypothetical protein